MKTWFVRALILLVPLSGCGQQLVEFGADSTTTVDLNAGRDFPPAMDLSMTADLSVTMDLAGADLAKNDLAMPDLSKSDLAMPDLLMPTGQPSKCEAALGMAQTFAVLGGQTVTSTGPTVIVGGNVGVSPGNTLTGIPPAVLIGGTIHLADPVAAQAQSDLTNAYNCAQGLACTKTLTGTDLGGLTLGPGVYCFASSAGLASGVLVLDAQGDSSATFTFQIASTLTIGDNARVHVINGGRDCSVFWGVGASATLGKNSRVPGNILALSSITLNTGATVDGRALARNGAVTMDSNDISVAICRGMPPLNGGADGGPGDASITDGLLDANP